MKKGMVGMLVTLALVTGLLAGCGSSTENQNSTDTQDSTVAQTADTQDADGAQTSDTESTELNLYTWDGMFPQEVLDGFEEETGIRINYTNFDLDEDMLAKLETTQGGEYDLVIADDYIIEMTIAEGLAQKLDTSKISGWENINPIYQGQFYDEQDEYTVPYGAGIPLIVYDPTVIDVDIKGYADLWNPALAGNIAMIGNYRVVDGIVLKTMGESFNTEDVAVIEEAGAKLKELAPNIRLISDTNTQDYLISGEAAVGFMYTSQVTQALMENENLKAVYPKEGVGFGIMAQFIPSNAPHADAAYAFIDYILRPEISAKCYEFIGYYCTNKAAESYISEEMQKYLVVPDSVTEGECIKAVSTEAEDAHSKIWTEFRALTE